MARHGFLGRRVLAFQRDAAMLWFAFRDPRTPRMLKAASLAAGLYLLSPIDLIPFTVPFLGVVDDLIIVPLAVSMVARRLPPEVRAETGDRANRFVARWFRRPLLALAAILLALALFWIAILYLLYRLIAG